MKVAKITGMTADEVALQLGSDIMAKSLPPRPIEGMEPATYFSAVRTKVLELRAAYYASVRDVYIVEAREYMHSGRLSAIFKLK